MLFGGYDGSYELGDFWEWDGSDWAARFSVHYPPARRHSAMTYDDARQRIILFGGVGSTGILGDTWEFDGVDWNEVTPAASPSPRWGHAMTFDAARQRVVLFGGIVGSGGSAFTNQTWEWDGATWFQRSSSQSPPARVEHAIAYDIVRQRTVLYGGYAGSNQEQDTWEWDGVDWVQRAATTPAIPNGRRRHTMAYDSVRQRVILFGGSSSGQQDDTVEWDGAAWTVQAPATSPPARENHSMAFDSTRQRMVLFGGFTTISDTWTRGQFGTAAVASEYGVGCGAPQLTFTSSPTGRPVIGQVASANIGNATSSVAAVAIGWSRDQFGPFALPVTLAGIGMPGCDLLQSSDVLGLATTSTGPSTLVFDQPLPNDLSIVGQIVYLQAYSFAPGANQLEVVASNGIEWIIGDL
jgi:hypothetical protein